MTSHQQSAVSLKKIAIETDCLSQKLKAEYLLHAQQHARVIHHHAADLVHAETFPDEPFGEGDESLDWRWVEHLAEVGGERTVLGPNCQYLRSDLSQG